MVSVQLPGEVVEAGSFQPVFGQIFKLACTGWEGTRCSFSLWLSTFSSRLLSRSWMLVNVSIFWTGVVFTPPVMIRGLAF